MAQKVTVELVDDVDGGPADLTLSFGLDGKSYEVDLSDVNAKRLREALAEFVEAARKPGSSPKTARASQAANREDPRIVRVWARENDWEISDHGRIPQEVWEAYEAR